MTYPDKPTPVEEGLQNDVTYPQHASAYNGGSV